MTALSDWVSFTCFEVTQPIGTFYVGSIGAADLTEISYSDVRRMAEKREVETYLGIERPLSPKRVAEIRKYVETIDASFPSSIILAVKSDNAEYDAGSGHLRLRRGSEVAKVLDGQHRIAGVEGLSNDAFQLIVTVFVDMDIENQAMLFATINLEQTKVNKSLVYDLYEYAKARSPQKTSHNIARLLDTEAGSPFEGKIKILGTAQHRDETISQAMFVDKLLEHISQDPVGDRDFLKRHRGRKLPAPSPAEKTERIFRGLFVDEDDAAIARILWNFFGAVSKRWPRAWLEVRQGYILNRTTGFRALMDTLNPIYLDVSKPDEIPSQEAFERVFARVQIPEEDLNSDEYRPGTSGQSDCATKSSPKRVSPTRTTASWDCAKPSDSLVSLPRYSWAHLDPDQ